MIKMNKRLTVKEYLELFIMFFKIGAFTIGGGYAMLPLIEREVVTNKKWLSAEEFVDVLAITQSSPGALAINASVFIGYKTGGVIGAVVGVLGTSLPSFLIILAIAQVFIEFRENTYVQSAFRGIRPAVFSLIAAAAIKLGKSTKVNKNNVIIPLLAFAAMVFLGFHPIAIIILSALGSIMFFEITNRISRHRQKDGGRQ
jgi:chromate transporter